MSIGDLASMIIALATTGSLIYFSRQATMTRQQAKGQFLLALDDQFEKSNAITIRLVNEENISPVGSDWPEVWRLMSVFERINVMVEDKILDVGLVERLHGFRLVYLIANDAIYERLEATGAEWQDFIDLCYAVADYRKRKRAVYGDDSAFAKRVYKLNKTTHRIDNPFRFLNEG
jgi:hypothetical protein